MEEQVLYHLKKEVFLVSCAPITLSDTGIAFRQNKIVFSELIFLSYAESEYFYHIFFPFEAGVGEAYVWKSQQPLVLSIISKYSIPKTKEIYEREIMPQFMYLDANYKSKAGFLQKSLQTAKEILKPVGEAYDQISGKLWQKVSSSENEYVKKAVELSQKASDGIDKGYRFIRNTIKGFFDSSPQPVPVYVRPPPVINIQHPQPQPFYVPNRPQYYSPLTEQRIQESQNK